MRLFLLPVSTRHTLLYCERLHQKPATEQSLLDKITNKATKTWVDWERADAASFWKGGWKKSLTVQGNRILRRIPYQEWGLKTVPPLSRKRKQAESEGREKIEVIYPGMFLKEDRIQGILTKLATERQALHRKRLIWSVIGMPISAPFALIPIIPNIPFFYLCFRAYSHWKALSGSKHLQFWLNNSLLTPMTSTQLDQTYTAGLMYPTRKASRESPSPSTDQIESVSNLISKQTKDGSEDVMLLQGWNGKLIAEAFNLPEMEVEIERAVEQVEREIKDEHKLKEEKKQIEIVTVHHHTPSEQPSTTPIDTAKRTPRE